MRGGGEGRPPQPPELPELPKLPIGRAFWVLIIAIIAFFVVFSSLAELYTDLLWFQARDLTRVFWVSLLPRWILFVLAIVVALLLIGGSWWGARLLVRREPVFFEEPVLNQPIVGVSIIGAASFLALLLGAGAGAQWENALRFWYRTPFGTTDPIFDRDIGFYVFQLPIYRFLQGWLMAVLVFALLGTAGLYALARLPQLRHRIYSLPRYMRIHLTFMGVAIALIWSFGYWLDRFDLLYSTRGVVFGASYTDIHAELLALNVLTALAVLVALLLLASLVTRNWLIPAGALGLWLVVNIALRGIYPAIQQNYVVEPNEFDRERPYIEYNIASTLKAYGLETLNSQAFTPQTQVTVEDVQSDQATVDNIRLWDYRPLLQTYAQLQEIRSYYDFHDVDIDRYRLGDDYRQVMLSARELDVRQLQNPTWVNTRLEFTHGYGIVMNPVNEINSRGLPVLYIKDLPPKISVPVQIDRPQIYYGEKPTTYVFVKTDVGEFDYPSGDANIRTTYEGVGGVSIGSVLRRLVFALRFGDTRILFTDVFTSESRVMFYRNIRERVRRVAPFLRYDQDPYLTVVDGQLLWIQDAYTVTDRYPYSEPVVTRDPMLAPYRGINYVRNSVKITIDAYDGTMTFYVADADDPLIQTWAKIFPDLFTAMDEMPAGIREHIRYPEGLFRIQSEVYRVYHMQNPNTFYNQEDVWEIPAETFQTGRQQPIEPYYVIMRLIGEDKAEFVLIVPFTPVDRDNLIAWMAGRSDDPNYGELVVYELPKQELIYGPSQIEALIDQDPEISAQLSLWSQRGSDVIRGNLLVIPVGESLMYVEPLYLRAEASELPELKRVIVSSGGSVVWSETFEGALAQLLGTSVLARRESPGVSEASEGTTVVVTREVADLARSAQQHWEAAQEALRAGDWAKYG
ncbi:MAG: UPF0182 family protein, partial [Anaerolineae bacterium]